MLSRLHNEVNMNECLWSYYIMQDLKLTLWWRQLLFSVPPNQLVSYVDSGWCTHVWAHMRIIYWMIEDCCVSMALSQLGCFSVSVSEQNPRSCDPGRWYMLITLHFAQPSLCWSLYILFRLQLRSVLSPGSIENASKGQLHTCCHTVGTLLLQTPRAFLSTALFSWVLDGKGCRRSWGRTTAVNRGGAPGWWASLMSFILRNERRLRTVRRVPNFPVFLRMWPRVSVC